MSKAMFIPRRASDRRATDFPVGSHVIARPATVAKPIAGVVVAISGAYTLTVSARGVEVAVDVEDCVSSNRMAGVWRGPSKQARPATG